MSAAPLLKVVPVSVKVVFVCWLANAGANEESAGGTLGAPTLSVNAGVVKLPIVTVTLWGPTLNAFVWAAEKVRLICPAFMRVEEV